MTDRRRAPGGCRPVTKLRPACQNKWKSCPTSIWARFHGRGRTYVPFNCQWHSRLTRSKASFVGETNGSPGGADSARRHFSKPGPLKTNQNPAVSAPTVRNVTRPLLRHGTGREALERC